MNMEPLILVMNKLHDVFSVFGSKSLQLPQIVVIGSQSSGKSSVLESLVGRDFLPRGTGIITRCPLILQLIYASKDKLFPYPNDEALQGQEWGMFLHTGEKIFSDFHEIRKEIVTETERKSGTNKGISFEAITLKIFSPYVVNLTLVDLPGITKVPVGDQPEDIEMQVRNLILQHISNPNAIILAVTAANTDFATSEAMKLARECDPEGKRTLAVITKLDLMDRGTNATEVLCGQVIPVELGIIGIVNRSQQDINDDKNVNDAIKDEALFFERNYSALAARNGTQYLREMLNKLLINHIKNCLPNLKTRVINKLAQYQSILQSYGNIVTDQNRLLLEIITKFTSSYCSTIEGTARSIETTELSGGARICYIFHEIFGHALGSIDPLDGLNSWEILTAIRNATGTRPSYFVPVTAFELLVKRQIQRLKEPSLRCVELVYEEMQRIVRICGSEFEKEIRRFPKLHEKIVDAVTQILQKILPVTNVMIENLVSIELAYINSRHPDFHHVAASIHGNEKQKEDKPNSKIHFTTGSSEARVEKDNSSGAKSKLVFRETSKPFDVTSNVKNSVGSCTSVEKKHEVSANESSNWFPRISKSMSYKIGDGLTDEISTFQALSNPGNLYTTNTCNNTRKLTDVEDKVCKSMENLISSYFNIVKKNIQDTVPKAIMHFLVNHVKDNLQSELILNLFKAENFSSLFQESEQVISGRKEATKMLELLQKSNEIIHEIRDISL